MDQAAVVHAIRELFDDVEVVEANGDTFFFTGDLPADRRMPFATIVTSDAYDDASALDRPDVFRLNLGVGRETYEAGFGPPPPGPVTASPVATGHDYAALDVLMPHPIYAPLGWVCILNPSDASFQAIRPLIVEAHDIAAARSGRRSRRG